MCDEGEDTATNQSTNGDPSSCVAVAEGKGSIKDSDSQGNPILTGGSNGSEVASVVWV